MSFDMAVEGPKLLMLLFGVIAFIGFVTLFVSADLIPRSLRWRGLAIAVLAANAVLLLLLAIHLPLKLLADSPLSGLFDGIPTILLFGIVAFAGVVALLLFLDALSADKDRWIAMGFLAPAVLLLVVGLIGPAVRTILLSFMGPESNSFVGLDNYRWMFTDQTSGMLPDFGAEPVIYGVLLNTLLWVFLVPTIATGIGLIYAVIIDKIRWESLAKSLVFMPMAISFVGAGIIWKFVYAFRQESAEQIGLLNQAVVWFGVEPQQWLLNGPWNTLFLIVVMIWIQAGFAMVILSAAIKAIPTDIVEAARLDGVTAWQMFWRVTIPSIRPALIVVLVTISIATLKVFDIVRTMTGGQFGTSVIANEMYNYAFRYNETGKGAALAVFLFVLVLPIVIYQVRMLRRRRGEAF